MSNYVEYIKVGTGDEWPVRDPEALHEVPIGVNILDNWYFGNPINQRGQTSYTGGGYTIDRWWFANQHGTLTVNNDYISIAGDSSGGYWKQTVEMTLSELGDYTMSLLTYEGDLYSATGGLNKAAAVTLDNSVYFYYETSSAGFVTVNLRLPASGTLNIKAIKLERGTTQTLARQASDGTWVLVDPRPNRQQELAKCQRYFIRLIGPTSESLPAFTGLGTVVNTTLFAVCSLPVPMRVLPSVKAASLELITKDIAHYKTVSSVDIYPHCATNAVIVEATSSETLTAGDIHYLVGRRSTSYLDLSADL